MTETSLNVRCKVRTRIPTEDGNFYIYLYSNDADDKEHLAIVYDRELSDGHVEHELMSKSLASFIAQNPNEIARDVRRPQYQNDHINGCLGNGRSNGHNGEMNGCMNGAPKEKPMLIRIHSECFTGEILGSQRCDCGEQLHTAMNQMAIEGRGIILYLRQEGRGIGLYDKLRAYNLQDQGYDTVEANTILKRQPDERCYKICGHILEDLGIKRVRLLTNNPDKVSALEEMGIDVVERMEMKPTLISSELIPYLKTKIAKLNHLLQI